MQTDTKAGTKGGVREFSRKRRLMNQAGSIVKNPYNIVVVISVIFMVYLILIPLGQMIIFGSPEGRRGRRGGRGKGGDVYPLLLETGSDQQHFPENAVDAP